MTATASDTINDVGMATLEAPAKINLTLEVDHLRDDGFHDIRSVVVGVDLCDSISCKCVPGAELRLECDDPRLHVPDNLILQAAQRFAESHDRPADFLFKLQKRIPVGGGLGGGSSDAAAALRLCNHLWTCGADSKALTLIGAGVGSDVPLFLNLPAAMMSGRGERVESVDLHWSGWALLVLIDELVETSKVYQAWRPTRRADVPADRRSAVADATTAAELTPLLFNDLERAVFAISPTVARAVEALERLGVGPLRVSGAGSTLFRLFDTAEEAAEVAHHIRSKEANLKTAVVKAPIERKPIITQE